MLYSMLAAYAALIFVLILAVPAKTHRLAPNADHGFHRLFKYLMFA